MIKNFNFYDIYGYFLPGLVFLVLIWLPFCLTGENLPTKDLTSAIAALALAYVVGNVLQTIAGVAFQSRFSRKTSEGKKLRRFPSDEILDADNKVFSREFKERLAEKIRICFGLDANINQSSISTLSQLEATAKQRKEAFLLCRSTLIANKVAGYAEQFEGMYTLMRGLAAAFIFSAVYYAGLASSVWFPEWLTRQYFWITPVTVIFALIFVAFHVFVKNTDYHSYFIHLTHLFLLLFAFSIGIYAVHYPDLADKYEPHTRLLIAFVFISLFVALKCYGGFKFFTNEFAVAIYRDFYNFHSMSTMTKKSTDKDEVERGVEGKGEEIDDEDEGDD